MAPTADRERLDRKHENVKKMLAKLYGAVSREPIADSVETMMTADGLRLTASGPDKDEIGVVEGAVDSPRPTGLPAGRA